VFAVSKEIARQWSDRKYECADGNGRGVRASNAEIATRFLECCEQRSKVVRSLFSRPSMKPAPDLNRAREDSRAMRRKHLLCSGGLSGKGVNGGRSRSRESSSEQEGAPLPKQGFDRETHAVGSRSPLSCSLRWPHELLQAGIREASRQQRSQQDRHPQGRSLISWRSTELSAGADSR